jgi:hypothetical protein
MVTRGLAQEMARPSYPDSACLRAHLATGKATHAGILRDRHPSKSMVADFDGWPPLDAGIFSDFSTRRRPANERPKQRPLHPSITRSLLQRRVARAIITRAFGIVSAPLCDRWCANAR